MVGAAVEQALKDAAYAVDWVRDGETALLAAASGSNDIALDVFAGTVAGLAIIAFLFGRRHDRAAA